MQIVAVETVVGIRLSMQRDGLVDGVAVSPGLCVQLNAFHFELVIAEITALLQRVAESVHTGTGQLQDIVGGFRIVAETFQIVLHRGDGIGQGVHAAPVRFGLVGVKQLFLNEEHALAQNHRRLAELDHFQTAAHGIESLRHRLQVLRVPLGSNELDDAVLGLFQAGTAFAQYRIHGLAHVAGHVALVAGVGLAATVTAADTRQGGFHIKQGAGDIHQGFAFGGTFAGDNVFHRVELFFYQGARLAKAKHCHGVGYLFQGDRLRLQFAGVAFATVDEGFQGILDGGDFLGQGLHHGIHGFGIRAGHAGPFCVDQVIGRECIVQAETGFDIANARAVYLCLGHVIKQVLDQFGGRRLVQAIGAVDDQFTQVAVHMTEHQFYRGAQGNGVFR